MRSLPMCKGPGSVSPAKKNSYLQHVLVELPYLGKKTIPRRIGIVHALGTLYPAGILCEEF